VPCTWSICRSTSKYCLLLDRDMRVSNHEIVWRIRHPYLIHHILNQIVTAALNLSLLIHWLDWDRPLAPKHCIWCTIFSDKCYRHFFIYSFVAFMIKWCRCPVKCICNTPFFSYFFLKKGVGLKASVSKTKERVERRILFSWPALPGLSHNVAFELYFLEEPEDPSGSKHSFSFCCPWQILFSIVLRFCFLSETHFPTN
jgi:hypothetical protein